MVRNKKFWKNVNKFFAFSLIKRNLRIVYSDNQSYITSLGTIMFMGAIMLYFTKYRLIAEQVGMAHANFEVIMQLLIAILFGVNIAILSYRLNYTIGVKTNTKGSTTFGALSGILLAGCPQSGSSLASLIGILPYVSFLPFYGLELKALGILALIYSTIVLLNKQFKRAIPRNLDLSKKHLEW